MNNALLDLSYFDFYQGLLTLVILLSGLILCLFFTSKTLKEIVFVSILYIWHTLFSFLYWHSSITGVADAIGYFERTFRIPFDINLSPGTRFVDFVTYIVRSSLDANYLNTMLVFNVIGFLGLVFLYLSLKKYLKVLPWYWGILLFLPSLSYWSSSIGKDAISFLSVCTLLYAVTTARKKVLLYVIAILLMVMVRPHVGFMMVASYVFYFIIRSKIPLILKLMTLPILTVSTFVLLKFATEYAGLDEISVSATSDYFDSRQGINNHGGGGIDTSSMSLPLKIFSYMFRPLPFEANSFITLIASIENSILLLLFIYLFYSSKSRLKLLILDKRLWLTTYIVLASIMLSYGLSNLGIAARQKWMFMPILIHLLIEVYSYNKFKKIR